MLLYHIVGFVFPSEWMCSCMLFVTLLSTVGCDMFVGW